MLVIDKPRGLTSHDVVAAARRALRITRIGHTGTLDPLATGVLPLAVGRATRVVRFLTASDKDYEATVRFGLTTDSYDVTGTETGRVDESPSRDAVLRALDALRGEYLQMPPVFSAKKVAGRRAYELARRDETVTLTPVPVRVARADLLDLNGPLARIALTCSAGFYVRSFAHSLGALTGQGACLEALRRTRSGEFGLEAALSLDDLHDTARVTAALVPLHALLGSFPAVRVTDRGRQAVSHGREVGASDYEPLARMERTPGPEAWVRLLDADGSLVAVGTAGNTPDSLHPSVVLI